MTGEHTIGKENSTLVLFCQAAHALPMREMVLLGEGMTHRHNVPQEQQKTIQHNHMLGEIIERLGWEAVEGGTIPTFGSSRRNVASA